MSKSREHSTVLDPERSDYFKDRCKQMGISESAAIRECLEHCGMIPRRISDLRKKAYAIGAAMLPSIHSQEFLDRQKYHPPKGSRAKPTRMRELRLTEPSLHDHREKLKATRKTDPMVKICEEILASLG